MHLAEKWKIALVGEALDTFNIECGPDTWKTDPETLRVYPTASNPPLPIIEALDAIDHPKVQITKAEAVAMAQAMIRAKKPSKEKAMAQLLSAIYGEEIEL